MAAPNYPDVQPLDKQTIRTIKGGLTTDKEQQKQIILTYIQKMYSDVYAAMVREVTSNAIDSHVRAGCRQPVKLTLPTIEHPVFICADHGTGMSKEFIEHPEKGFFTVGHSDKWDRDNELGRFGAGAKAIFGYLLETGFEQASMVSVHNGWKGTYTLYVTEDIQIAGDLLAEGETNEPNGVTFTVPVNVDDIVQISQEVMRFRSSLVEIQNTPETAYSGDEFDILPLRAMNPKCQILTLRGVDYTLYYLKAEKKLKPRASNGLQGAVYVSGIPYDLTEKTVNHSYTYSRSKTFDYTYSPSQDYAEFWLELHIPPEDITLSPTREHIDSSSHKFVHEKINQIRQDWFDYVKQLIDQQPNLPAAEEFIQNTLGEQKFSAYPYRGEWYARPVTAGNAVILSNTYHPSNSNYDDVYNFVPPPLNTELKTSHTSTKLLEDGKLYIYAGDDREPFLETMFTGKEKTFKVVCKDVFIPKEVFTRYPVVVTREQRLNIKLFKDTGLDRDQTIFIYKLNQSEADVAHLAEEDKVIQRPRFLPDDAKYQIWKRSESKTTEASLKKIKSMARSVGRANAEYVNKTYDVSKAEWQAAVDNGMIIYGPRDMHEDGIFHFLSQRNHTIYEMTPTLIEYVKQYVEESSEDDQFITAIQAFKVLLEQDLEQYPELERVLYYGSQRAFKHLLTHAEHLQLSDEFISTLKVAAEYCNLVVRAGLTTFCNDLGRGTSLKHTEALDYLPIQDVNLKQAILDQEAYNIGISENSYNSELISRYQNLYPNRFDALYDSARLTGISEFVLYKLLGLGNATAAYLSGKREDEVQPGFLQFVLDKDREDVKLF